MFNNFAKIFTGFSILALVLTVFAQTSSSKEPATNPDSITLSASNMATLTAEVDGDSVGKVLSQIKKLKCDSQHPINLYLDTPGGSIQAGLVLIEGVSGLNCRVNTITMFAASMGFQIAQNLNDRLILRNGTLMSHHAKGAFQGEFGGQDPSQVDSRLNFWKSRLQELDEQTVRRTNGKQTLESYQSQYASELWMTGKQSVERGYADRVVTVKCDKTLDGVTNHQVEYMGVPVSFDLDLCPLNTEPQNIKIGLATNQGIVDSDDFVRRQGSFDAVCLVTNNDKKLCSLDTSMNLVKINQIKTDFLSQFVGKQRQIIPMTW
jgi:ATP-dependent Clp protease protease subunit